MQVVLAKIYIQHVLTYKGLQHNPVYISMYSHIKDYNIIQKKKITCHHHHQQHIIHVQYCSEWAVKVNQIPLELRRSHS